MQTCLHQVILYENMKSSDQVISYFVHNVFTLKSLIKVRVYNTTFLPSSTQPAVSPQKVVQTYFVRGKFMLALIANLAFACFKTSKLVYKSLYLCVICTMAPQQTPANDDWTRRCTKQPQGNPCLRDLTAEAASRKANRGWHREVA